MGPERLSVAGYTCINGGRLERLRKDLTIVMTGHPVWSTIFICSSFIRPPWTSIVEKALSI
jgi:hypothetical protein